MLFSAAAQSTTTDDLISWSSPSSSQSDSVKSSVLELYKASTPVQPGVAGPGQFSPMTALTPFSFVQDSSGFLAPPPVVSPVEPRTFHPQRTVFPTMGKLGRLEYPLQPGFSHAKPSPPFSGGKLAKLKTLSCFSESFIIAEARHALSFKRSRVGATLLTWVRIPASAYGGSKN